MTSPAGRRRVVSLVPSITESLRVWGLDPVACTRYCEQPDLTTVGGTKNPDVAAIVRLEPDVVLVDRVENRREDAEAMAAAGLLVVDVDVRTLADVGPAMQTIADAAGLALPAEFVEALVALEAVGSAGSAEPGINRRAFVPIWRRPWMTIGPATYGSTLLAAIGVGNVYADATVDFPEVELGDATARQPDVVLVPSEPYDFGDDHLAELAAVARPVRVDGQDLFWWGARTPAAVDRLSGYLAAP